MIKSKKVLSIVLTLCMVLSMLPATAWAGDPDIINITTDTGYGTLTEALNAAADGDTIQLLHNITESASYNATVDKIITIDGQGNTITGANGDNSSALQLSGEGIVVLKDLKLLGGDAVNSSVGLYTSDQINVVSIGTVTVTGGTVDGYGSYGLNNSSSGIISVTTATGRLANFSYGVLQQGTGTVNVNTATGGLYRNSAVGVYCFSANGNVNVNTATGRSGVFNCDVGTVNVNTAVSTITYGVTNISTGTVNVGSTSGSAISNTGSGVVNTGASVAAITLLKGSGASCVLDTITVATSGIPKTSLPTVYKDRIFGQWYTDEAKTTLYNGSAVTDGMKLYSSFYEKPLSIQAIAGIAVPVKGAVPTASITDTTEYTAGITWSANPSVFAANTTYTATITLTPKAGYTVFGVAKNFFTVNGATASNSADTGVITAVFPATAGSGGGSSVVSYTVTFHSNGGTQISSATVRSGNTISAPADPSKEGFAFAGWYKDAALTKAFDFSAPIGANTEMYAKWTPAPQAAQQFTMIFNIGQADSYLTSGSAVKTLRTMDAAPILSGNRTFLPIRFVLEPMGGSIAWNQTEKKVTITNGSTTIELWIGSNMAKVNGVSRMIDPDNTDVVPLLVKPGRAMLPLRFISESLGCTVSWDQATQQVTVIR